MLLFIERFLYEHCIFHPLAKTSQQVLWKHFTKKDCTNKIDNKTFISLMEPFVDNVRITSFGKESEIVYIGIGIEPLKFNIESPGELAMICILLTFRYLRKFIYEQTLFSLSHHTDNELLMHKLNEWLLISKIEGLDMSRFINIYRLCLTNSALIEWRYGDRYMLKQTA